MRYHLVPVTENEATGPISVSYMPCGTCPLACPFRVPLPGFAAAPCYLGGIRTTSGARGVISWRKVSRGERGVPWPAFVDGLERLPRWQMHRGCVAGDQPGDGIAIDRDRLLEYSSAVGTMRAAWSYTHHLLTEQNVSSLLSSQAMGYVVNVSCESTTRADQAIDSGLSAVLGILPGEETGFRTPKGRPVVWCPKQREHASGREFSCRECGNGKPLCARPHRPYVVGLRAHGCGARQVNMILRRERENGRLE